MKTRLFRRLVLLAVSALLSLVGIAALGAASASAQPLAPATVAVPAIPGGNPACPLKTWCTYIDLNYDNGDSGNPPHWFYTYNSPWTPNQWHYVGNDANDQISSMIANRSWTTAFAVDFTSNPTTSQWACLLGGHSMPDLSQQEWLNHASMNDSISAFYFWTSSGNGGCPQTF